MKKSLILFLISCVTCCLAAETDPFYAKALKEGKELLLQKKYAEAIDSLRVAEFGILDQPDLLKELIFYHSLALYKLQKFGEAKKMLEKMGRDLDVKDWSALERPKEIEPDILAMLTTLGLIKPAPAPDKSGKAAETSKTPRGGAPVSATPAGFADVYARALPLILNNRLPEAEREIRRLKDLDRKHPLLRFLQGLLSYQKHQFSDAADLLEEAVTQKGLTGEDLETALYYLCLANYQTGHFGLTLFYSRQSSEKTNKQLAEVLAKIGDLRAAAIAQFGKDFARRDFDKLHSQFAGDSELCHDLLRHLLDNYRFRTQSIKEAIDLCLESPGCTDTNFIMLAVEYYRSRSEYQNAIDLIESSRFYKEKRPNRVDIHLMLGELCFEARKYKKAIEVFERIRTFAPKNAEAAQWLDKVKKAVEESKK